MAFENPQIVDRNGNVVAVSRPGVVLSATPTGAPFATSLSVETFGPVQIGQAGDAINWIMTVPILGADEQPQGVVIADLNVAVLGKLLNPYGLDAVTNEQEVHVVNAQHLLLYSSTWGKVGDETAEIAKGALQMSRGRDLRAGDEHRTGCKPDRRLPKPKCPGRVRTYTVTRLGGDRLDRNRDRPCARPRAGVQDFDAPGLEHCAADRVRDRAGGVHSATDRCAVARRGKRRPGPSARVELKRGVEVRCLATRSTPWSNASRGLEQAHGEVTESAAALGGGRTARRRNLRADDRS